MKECDIHKTGCLVAMAIVTILVCPILVHPRNDDVVILKNGDRMTGEIKGLQRGELKFKASYMAESVRLDWSKVERLESRGKFLVLLIDGKLLTDSIGLQPGNFVIGNDQTAVRVRQLDVIRLAPVEATFWSRLEGTVDLGFNYTSGNEQYQTQFNATAQYLKGDHLFTANVESVFSGQNEAESTARKGFTLKYRKKVSRNWYVGGLFDLLSSDQQSLNLRTTVGGYLGRSLKQTERTRFSVFGGLVGTREDYSVIVEQERKNNVDALAGFDFQAFRFKTTDVSSTVLIYPSLTIPGRVRVQANSSVRFELFKDLTWGFNVYEKIDAKPPLRADKNDLGISTTLGWKF